MKYRTAQNNNQKDDSVISPDGCRVLKSTDKPKTENYEIEKKTRCDTPTSSTFRHSARETKRTRTHAGREQTNKFKFPSRERNYPGTHAEQEQTSKFKFPPTREKQFQRDDKQAESKQQGTSRVSITTVPLGRIFWMCRVLEGVPTQRASLGSGYSIGKAQLNRAQERNVTTNLRRRSQRDRNPKEPPQASRTRTPFFPSFSDSTYKLVLTFCLLYFVCCTVCNRLDPWGGYLCVLFFWG